MAEYLRSECLGKDMSNSCRLCLRRSIPLLHVFESKGMPAWTAANAINELLRIEVCEGDIYPKFICTECMGKLVEFKLFKDQCEINKDSFDLEYSRNCGVGDDENVVGMVLCCHDNQSELHINEEEEDIPIENDPLDLSEEHRPIKSEIEENSIEYNETSQVIGSADEIFYPMKCEYEEQETTEETNEFAVDLKEEYPEVNSPCEMTINPDHGIKEEHEDIKSESSSNGFLEEEFKPEVSEAELMESVHSNSSPSLQIEGYSLVSGNSTDVHGIDQGNDIRGPSGVSGSSMVGDVFGEGDLGDTRSNPVQSPSDRIHSSCNMSQNVVSDQQPNTLSQCSDKVVLFSENHEETQLVEKESMCMICLERFATPDLLRDHMTNHFGGKQPTQVGCRKIPIRWTKSKKPVKPHHSQPRTKEKRFNCINCSERFSQRCQLTQHVFHSGDQPFSCNHCRKEFFCRNNLRIHLSNYCTSLFELKDKPCGNVKVNSDLRPFKCKECKLSFLQYGHLQVHMRIHSGEIPYRCNICRKSFIQMASLKGHMTTHSGGKPFKCDKCTKTFTLKGSLKIHSRTHSGEKPYKCDLCDKFFTRMSHLKDHNRLHTGERPFKCNLCSRMFSQRSHVRVHMKTHTRERSFKCERCSKTFCQISSLKRHKAIHSGETSPIQLAQ